MSLSGAAMFSSGAAAAEERESLWNHSLGCATIARLLAQYVPLVSADEAFLAGVFHDVLLGDHTAGCSPRAADGRQELGHTRRSDQTFPKWHPTDEMRKSIELQWLEMAELQVVRPAFGEPAPYSLDPDELDLAFCGRNTLNMLLPLSD